MDRGRGSRSSTPTSKAGYEQKQINKSWQIQPHPGSPMQLPQQLQVQRYDVDGRRMIMEEHMLPPEFVMRIQPCHAADGEEARFECTFRGEPEPTVSWYRENKLVKPSDSPTILTDTQNCSSTIIIHHVHHQHDNTEYTVKAENAAGSAQSSANLMVEPQGLYQQQQQETLAITQDGSPRSPTYSGSEQQHQLYNQEKRQQQQQRTQQQQQQHREDTIISTYERNLNNPRKPRSEDFSQRNTNQEQQHYLRQQQHQERLTQYREPPKNQHHMAPWFMSKTQEFVERKEGDSLHLECCLGPHIDDPDLKTEWFFNGEPLVTGSRFHTIDDFGFIVLDIDWLYQRDSGEYVCKVSNSFGSDSTKTLLNVKPAKKVVKESQLEDPMVVDKLRQLEYPNVKVEPAPPQENDKPPKFVKHLMSRLNQRQFMEGQSVHLEARICPSQIDNEITVEWFHNGEPLPSGHRFRPNFEFDHIKLDILSLYPEDSGNYTCIIKTAAGQATSEFDIQVIGKPSLDYQSQLPREMIGGIRRINEMEAQWDKLSETIEGERSGSGTGSRQQQDFQRASSSNSQQPHHHKQQQEQQQVDLDQALQQQQMAPRFMSHIQDYIEKNEGDSLHLECCLGPIDDPDLKTEWFFNGRPLVTGSRFHTIDDFGFIVLDIDWLFPRDTGEYVCKATNKHGSDLTRTVLRVKPDKNVVLESQLDNPQVIDKLRQLEFPDVEQEPMNPGEPNKPARFVQHLKTNDNKNHFVEGDNVHFEARVAPATDGELTVEWFHNDQPLISGHRFKPTFDFGHIVLDILYLYPEDTGIYKCVTRNASGIDVSQYEINVKGKPSLVYQSQLPKEMIGGVKKITEMEAQWNKPTEETDEVEVKEKCPPQFVLKPKPYSAFEGSCARFCCRIMANPRPRITWILNGQTVVTGSRYKLTYDGMYHLTIPKCQLTDAGKLEVYARNLLGECFATTELKVRKKVDDYRGVLKNSPNPWYDEQSLKVYQRHRSSLDLSDQDEDSEFNQQFQQLKLKIATEQQLSSPIGNQLIGYMEPGTPDVNLLLASSSTERTQSPLVGPGDLHPVVAEQQVVMAPAPSTIQRALKVKDEISAVPEKKSFQQQTSSVPSTPIIGANPLPSPESSSATATATSTTETLELDGNPKPHSNLGQGEDIDTRRIFGVDSARHTRNVQQPKAPSTAGTAATSGFQKHLQEHNQSSWMSQKSPPVVGSPVIKQQKQEDKGDPLEQHMRRSPNQQRQQLQSNESHQQQAQVFGLSRRQQKRDNTSSPSNQNQRNQQQEQYRSVMQQDQATSSTLSDISSDVEAGSLRQLSPAVFDARLPPPSPESKVHGKEVHSHTHKQIQLERHTNREIKREIIDKDIFEQEHSGTTKENVVRGNSMEGRGSTPTNDSPINVYQQHLTRQQQQHQQRKGKNHWQQQQKAEQEFESMEGRQVLIEEHMFPPEFIMKLQPCQAVDGQEGRFECTYKGDPKPTISWYCDGKLIKPSNLYSIITDSENDKSTLIIKRIHLNSNAVYTVKAQNTAGSAKSSANLVVEPISSQAQEKGQLQFNSSMSSQAVAGPSGYHHHHHHQQQQQQQLMQPRSSQTSTTITSSSLLGDNDFSIDSSLSDSQASGKRVRSVKTRKLRMNELNNLVRASPEGLMAPTFLHTVHDTVTKPGELVRLDARLIGSQPMEVKWLKDGERLRPDRSHKLVLEGDLYTLLILECTMKDEGFYECHAVNQIGEAYCGATLAVAGPGSQFATEMMSGRTSAASGAYSLLEGAGSRSSSAQGHYSNIEGVGGGSTVTNITTTTSSAATTTQTKGQSTTTSTTMNQGDRFETDLDPVSGQRKQFGVTKHYYNNPLMDQYAKTSDRSDNILSLIKGLDNQQVREGRSATLRCQISSFPIAEVQWFKQGDKLIKPSKYFRIYKDNDETYCLKILETFPEDQGEYKCLARTPNGKTFVETKANITVIPNSPK